MQKRERDLTCKADVPLISRRHLDCLASVFRRRTADAKKKACVGVAPPEPGPVNSVERA